MSQWRLTDEANSSPIWSAAQLNKASTRAEANTLFGNTTANAYFNNVTIGSYGVSGNPGELAGTTRIASVTVTAAGSGFTVRPTVTFDNTGTGGTGVAGNTTARVVSLTVGDTKGSGYSPGDTLSTGDGTGTAATINVTSIGTISSQDETSFNASGANGTFVGGSDFDAADTITLSDGSVITVDTVAANVVTEFTVTSNSTSGNTTNNPTLTQSATSGSGTGFTLTLGDDNQQVFALALLTGGSFTVLPTLDENALANTTGTGSSATADLVMGLNTVTLTDQGSGYSSAPTVTIGGSGGVGATATAVLQATGAADGASAGWNLRTELANGRVRYECLVATPRISGDADDDAVLPE